MSQIIVPVDHWLNWWRAPLFLLNEWVPQHPDHPHPSRHADEGDHRWNLVAEAVVKAGEALSIGEVRLYDFREALEDHDRNPERGYLSPYHNVETTLLVSVDLGDSELTDKELDIVRSWFSSGISVCADPWATEVLNGRHRLWHTLQHFNEGDLVPVRATGSPIPWDSILELSGSGRIDLGDKVTRRWLRAP